MNALGVRDMTLAALESAFSANPGNINAAHALIEGLRAEIEQLNSELDTVNDAHSAAVIRARRAERECERKDAALREIADLDKHGGYNTACHRARSALASTGEG